MVVILRLHVHQPRVNRFYMQSELTYGTSLRGFIVPSLGAVQLAQRSHIDLRRSRTSKDSSHATVRWFAVLT